MASDDYDKIRSRAYELWEKEGRPSGRERQHWEQAEREFAREAAGKGAEAAPRETAAAEHKAAAQNPSETGTTPNRDAKNETSVAGKEPETATSGKQEEAAAKAEPKGKRRAKRNRRLWKWLAEEGGGEPIAAT